ncbi:PREDICTED: polyubiquitin-like [Cyprinodon variegatus]|uniref:polyubiquitin-like n=1 Tax=Cyprinodon variegatus TaxID=28743 RepID=UPI000742BAA7|nr:PREDICTED: polyubiquitin-like [Cyprinodon variegatus]
MDIVIVMLNGTSRTLRVNPNDTVGDLKERIQNEMGCLVSTQKLVFTNGQSTNLNDDSRTLRSYNMQSGSQVSLLITQPSTFQVFLQNEKGKTSTYDITGDETVENFKRRVQEREGVPANQFRLIHEGREMQGGKLTDYNVKKHSTITMALRLRGG